MCLQWCHTTKRLIDNDLPCIGCTHFPHRAAPGEQSCATCAHRVVLDGQVPFCGLSKAPLPLTQHCCHWNAIIETRSILLLTDSDVAPGVLEMWGVASVGALFARSNSAPEVASDIDGRVSVALDELALPLVYGVPAAQWDMVLPDDTNDWPHDAVIDAPPDVVAVVVALLDALDPNRSDGDADATHAQLCTLLEVHPLGELPDPWPSLIAEALALYAVREVRPE